MRMENSSPWIWTGDLPLGQALVLPKTVPKNQAGPLQMGIEVRYKAGVQVLPLKLQGHLALGRDTGAIAPGKIADLILIDFTAPNLFPCHDIVENLVYSAAPSNVVMI